MPGKALVFLVACAISLIGPQVVAKASEVPPSKPSFLLDKAAWCIATGCQEDVAPLLVTARQAVLKQLATPKKVLLLLEIARLQAQIDDEIAATSTLDEAMASMMSMPSSSSRSELQQRLALGFRALGAEETARMLDDDAEIATDASQAAVVYPFPESQAKVAAGIAVSGTSFNEVTANGSVNLNIFKSWRNQDFSFDTLASLNYDTGRDDNRFKPDVNSTAVYRYHLDNDWSVFVNNLNAVNSGVIIGSSGDDDTSVLSASFLGPGLNLWRGSSVESFLDLQLGFGARYEYDEISLETVRNRISPSVVLILYGRAIPIGKALFAPTVGVGLASEQLDELVMYTDLNLKIPISKSWAWNSRVVARYSTDNPGGQSNNLNFQYLTGLTYKFSP